MSKSETRDHAAKIEILRDFARMLFQKNVRPGDALPMLKLKIVELDLACTIEDGQITHIFSKFREPE